ncbi:MAG: Rieske 2Fe-2S domain-containing protein [Acidimicrobiales bacterium]
MASNHSTSGRFVGAPPSAAAAGWALLPLRAFIGATFTFAGLQKLANPGFFDANNPISIQSQLQGAAHSSPIHALLGPLHHVAVPLGVVLALGELAVGLGTLVGLWSRIAAVGGILLSLSLFLTISFHASPYYTGSDIVFVFAWLPLLVAGSGGVLSLDAFLGAHAADGAPGAAASDKAGSAGGVGDGTEDGRRHELDRRTFALRGAALGGVGALGVVLAGAASGLGRLFGHYADAPSPSATPSTTAPAAATTTTPGSTPTTPPGTKVLAASSVVVGGSATFTAPKTGDPAVAVQPTAGSFAAFDTICPHEGCTVAYFASDGLFICPCHGSRFNGRTGALVKGPATRGLTAIPIAEGPDGELYAV